MTLLVQSAGYHFWLVYQLCSFLDRVTHALIVASGLNYCNVLYMKLPLQLVWNQQLVQNVAASILSGASPKAHIASVLKGTGCQFTTEPNVRFCH